MTTSAYPGSATPLPVRKTNVAVTGGPLSLFTISGGRVMIYALYGVVTTVIGGVATTLRIDANPTTGSDSALCAASADIATGPVGSLLSITGTLSDALSIAAAQGALESQARPVIVAPGTIDLIIASGGTTGAIDWYIAWEPLDAGATLVAA